MAAVAALRTEFGRLGAYAADSGWRETELNHAFALCPTYPQVLLVPAACSDDVVREVAEFRSKQRLPALSWLNARTGAAIVRCAQPLVGVLGRKSEADEQLFQFIAQANPVNQSIAMVDARPYLNALVNRGRAGGFEDMSRYEESEASLAFLGVENIHEMRESLAAMHALGRSFAPKEIGGAAEVVTLTDVHETKWLAHVGAVLGGAAQMVEEVTVRNRTVILHCSDGWDRTAQLCSLAEMALDPYYRTLAGLRELLAREWLGFGHKFRDRVWGAEASERSPVFMQFLDAAHQLVAAHPAAFEYGDALLLRLVDTLYANEHSDFRHNCARERTWATGAWSSCWPALLADPGLRNPTYAPEQQVGANGLQGVRPGASLAIPLVARVWLAYFNRWTDHPLTGTVADGVLPRAPALEAVLQLPAAVAVDAQAGAVQAAGALVGPRFEWGPVLASGWLWQRFSVKSTKFRHFHLVGASARSRRGALLFYDAEEDLATLVRPTDT